MGCDVDPDKVSAGQPDEDKDIEQIEANGRNNEQVLAVGTGVLAKCGRERSGFTTVNG
jgi:hypothetical protein